jgi:hypothetical protein
MSEKDVHPMITTRLISAEDEARIREEERIREDERQRLRSRRALWRAAGLGVALVLLGLIASLAVWPMLQSLAGLG